MRDRLIELMLNAPQIPCIKGGQATGKRYQTFQNIADYLLANGVILPPCKVGEPVWFVEEGGDIGFSLIEKIRIEQRAKWNPELVFNCIYLVDFLRPIPFSAIGRAVFLTKEEAEKALKERDGDA